MTDRETITPPPPDRERDTDPPLPTDRAPPEFVTLSDYVVDGFDKFAKRLDSLDKILSGITEQLDGIRSNTASIMLAHKDFANTALYLNQAHLRVRTTFAEHDARITLLEIDVAPLTADTGVKKNGN